MGAVCSCCGRGRNAQGLYEPVLQENEREAVADLLQFLENRNDDIFFEGEPLRALTTLSYSDNVELQRSASLAFAEITERHVEEVDSNVLEPLLYLLKSSSDVEVQRASSAALGNLAVNVPNKLKIVRLGGLESLIKQMISTNVEVQCNAVGCITNLATHEENKTAIARSGALVPLVKLAKTTKDVRVQRNATGALLNMTHSDEHRRELMEAGALPVLLTLLRSADVDVVYYCTTALSNLAVDTMSRRRIAQESRSPPPVSDLIDLMESPALKVQCQAALALRNLASDENFQLDIARHPKALRLLLALMTGTSGPSVDPTDPNTNATGGSVHPQLILAAVACIRNISIHPLNESKIIEAGFLRPLVDLLDNENEEVQCHTISTLRNLAAGSGASSTADDPSAAAATTAVLDNKDQIVDSGALEKIRTLMERALASTTTSSASSSSHGLSGLSWAVLSEMTACLAVLALSDKIKPMMLNMGMVHVLLPFTRAHVPPDVQGNAAAALGNLATKAPDMSVFLLEWDAICNYLERFLEPIPSHGGSHYHHRDEAAATFQHIAIWTVLQFCESGDPVKSKLMQRSHLLRLIQHVDIISQDEEVDQLVKRVLDHVGLEYLGPN